MEDWKKKPKGMPGGRNDGENWMPAPKEEKTEQPTGSDKLKKKDMLKAWLDS